MSHSFEFRPEKLVYGGEALGYHQGRVVLVPRALPGEHLEVEEVRTAKGVVRARALRVLEAAPDRVAPPCPYFGRCGGCHYQHLAAESQTAAKREIVRETLRRIGKIAWDAEIPVHAAHPWGYRNQAQLKVDELPDGQVGLGFFEAESHRLFPLDICLILSPRLNAVLGQLGSEAWSPHLAQCREVELFADDQDECVMLTLHGNLSPEQGEAVARDMLARLGGVVTVAINSGRGCRAYGRPTLEYTLGEFRYHVSPGSFFQASRFLLSELVAAVTGNAAGALALDLFAGVGLFTLPLARRFSQVVAVELERRAVADLQRNAETHAIQNVRSVRGSVLDFLRRFAPAAPELVVLDPPRVGVGAATLRLLLACRPRHIHYVSCSPPTLARDLAYLVKRGYGLDSVELFDFFPQTFHIECLAKLVRHDRAGG